jgi:hypothetical protein
MTHALAALLLAGTPFCIAARASQACQCDDCGKRSSGLARGSISAFNRLGVPVLHYCAICTKEAPPLLCLYGLDVVYVKAARDQTFKPLPVSAPEPKAIQRINRQTQFRRLRELGHGFPWQRQRRYS